MFHLAWILSYAILVAANPQQPGKRGCQPPYLRILDGYEVEIEDRPFQVYLDSRCGGSIIGSKWIISAAHCAPPGFVIVGSKSIYEGKIVRVKDLIVHPSYVHELSLNYDMMLIELADELVFDETVQPIVLDDGEETMVGEEAMASGWGSTEDCVNPMNLLALKLTIMDNRKCRAIYSEVDVYPGIAYPVVGNSMICASSPGSTFNGDSGGPLTVGHKLVGITSWGASNTDISLTKKYPAVFARVSSARDWIRKVTGI